MKRILFIAIIQLCCLLGLILFLVTASKAQTPVIDWAKGMGGTDIEMGNSIAVDASGNVYTTGVFFGTADFDPGASIFNLSAGANGEIFILKLNAAGNFVWAVQMGALQDDRGLAIALDASGDVYVTGYFQGTVDFNPGAPTFDLVSNGSMDVFVCKLSSAGNFVWAKKIGGADADGGMAITLDATGNVHIAGYFDGTVDFDPDTGISNMTSIGPGSADIFVLKLNNSGNFIWARQMGGGNNADQGRAIAVDPSGNVYVAGTFDDTTTDFDPGASILNLASVGQRDIFITKLNVSGNLVWAKSVGGIDDDYGNTVKVDASGNVYIAGSFSETPDFNPGTATFPITSAGDSDMYILKLDNNGNFLWAKSMGGDSDDSIASLFLDASGNIYTTGYFSTIADFDPGATTFNVTCIGGYDVFVSKLDAAGNFGWAVRMGASGIDQGRYIDVDASGNVYVTGYFLFTVDFDPGAGTADLTYHGNAANPDMFVQKLNVPASGAPTITSFNPGSGPVGTTVVITGTNFSAVAANNIVQFNGVTAVVTSSTSTTITTIVPSGTKPGKVTVTVAGITATSAADFNLTPGTAVAITSQPIAATVCSGTSTSFSVAAGGTTNISYQWQINSNGFVDLQNDATYSGVTTATLTIAAPTVSLNGKQYRCLIKGDNAVDTPSLTVVLTVQACNAPQIIQTVNSAFIEGIVTIDLASLISDVDNNLDLSTLQILTQPVSGAPATLNGLILTINYKGVPFPGRDDVTVRVCDLTNMCTQQKLTVILTGEIEVFTALSPNDDGKNETFYLKYIDVLPETKNNVVTIFNRWGDKVYEGHNYDNVKTVFKGEGSNGSMLPTGTYFYKIQFPSGRQTETGSLYLKR